MANRRRVDPGPSRDVHRGQALPLAPEGQLRGIHRLGSTPRSARRSRLHWPLIDGRRTASVASLAGCTTHGWRAAAKRLPLFNRPRATPLLGHVAIVESQVPDQTVPPAPVAAEADTRMRPRTRRSSPVRAGPMGPRRRSGLARSLRQLSRFASRHSWPEREAGTARNLGCPAERARHSWLTGVLAGSSAYHGFRLVRSEVPRGSRP